MRSPWRGPAARTAAAGAAILGFAACVIAGPVPLASHGRTASSVGVDLTVPLPTTTTTQAPPPPTSTTSTTTGDTTTTAGGSPQTTTTTVAAAPPTTTASSGGYGAALYPCSASPGGPCSVSPTGIEISYPVASPAPDVTLQWAPVPGRPSGAPAPASPAAVLDHSSAGRCPTAAPTGSAVECWSWPPSLRSSGFVLNGTYTATPCQSVSGSSGCNALPGTSPLPLALAATPAAPLQPAATVSGAVVTVTWQPSAAPEPDLVGYLVTRNGHAAFACSSASWYSGHDAPCPAKLAATDRPGGGLWTYQVSAVRLGEGTGTDALVSSPGTAASTKLVTVMGPAAPRSAGGSAALPPVPLTAAFPGAVGPNPAAAPAAPTLSGGDSGVISAEPGAAGDQPVQNLTYPSSGSPLRAAPSAAFATRRRVSQSTLVPGLVAVALIALALAGEVLYLRSRLALVGARRGRAATPVG